MYDLRFSILFLIVASMRYDDDRGQLLSAYKLYNITFGLSISQSGLFALTGRIFFLLYCKMLEDMIKCRISKLIEKDCYRMNTKISARPTYFDKFVCAADKCRHSCCAPGWEIDIDSESAARYRRMRGSFGRELRENIQYIDGEASFKLCADGRCPFLDDRGLCRIILERGDDALCDICREHPRFYNFLPYREEAGLGLYCEAVCKLIINEKEPSGIIEQELPCYDGEYDDYTDDEVRLCLALAERRDNAIKTVTDPSLPFYERIRMICREYGISDDDACFVSTTDMLEYMRMLEPLDGTWIPLIDALTEHFEEIKGTDLGEYVKMFENLTVYYLYRYYIRAFDGDHDPSAYVRFAVLSVRFIGLALAYAGLSKRHGLSEGEIVDVICNYSDQIESCEENVEALLKKLSEC